MPLNARVVALQAGLPEGVVHPALRRSEKMNSNYAWHFVCASLEVGFLSVHQSLSPSQAVGERQSTCNLCTPIIY